MQTYWDLSEAERAALTRDDVAKYADLELMTKGVLRPKSLALPAETSIKLETTTYFQIEVPASYGAREKIHGLVFRTEEDARAVIAMRPVLVSRDYEIGSTEFAKALDASASVTLCTLASEEAVASARAVLKEAAAAKEEASKRRREFDEQNRKVDQALAGMWDDWHSCVGRDREMRRVAETFTEYERMAGSKEIASVFLRKAFATDVVREAEEWTGVRMVFSDAVVALADSPTPEAQVDDVAL